jgi:6-phosphogluconolactonase (cycloisomerase 2 family)
MIFPSLLPRFSLLVSSSLLSATLAFAASPVVIVASPAGASNNSSPVHFIASATSPGCAKGIAAMRIYVAPQVSVYTVESSHLDTEVVLSPGNFNTVIAAWDNCGGVGKASVNIAVAATGLRPARFLYVADDATNKVWSFNIDPSTGVISPTGQRSVATNSSYRLASDKGGYRLYVTNAAPVPFGRVYGYFIDRRNGSLHAVPRSPFSVDTTPGPVTVHPSGKFVFVGTVTLQPGDGILAFRVNADGSLTPLNSTPTPTKSTPNSMAVDRWGKYLYVSSSGGDSIDAFEVDVTSGALTPVPGSPYTVATPGCVSSSPSGVADLFGRYHYTSDEGSSEITGYAIAGRTGTLTELARSPLPVLGGCTNDTGPRKITTEPTGRFLYVMNGEYLSIYSINAGNGFLTHLKDTRPISSGQLFGPLRTDPSGKFLFTAKSSGAVGDEVIGFSIDPTSGDLTALPGSPFPIGPNVEAFDLAVTP